MNTSKYASTGCKNCALTSDSVASVHNFDSPEQLKSFALAWILGDTTWKMSTHLLLGRFYHGATNELMMDQGIPYLRTWFSVSIRKDV